MDPSATSRRRALSPASKRSTTLEHMPLLSDPDACAYDDQRGRMHASPVPWKSLLLTVFLFSMGTISLCTSVYLFLGYGYTKDPDKWKALSILGSLCMIPGAYYLFHFLMIAIGIPGWSYDDIPEV